MARLVRKPGDFSGGERIFNPWHRVARAVLAEDDGAPWFKTSGAVPWDGSQELLRNFKFVEANAKRRNLHGLRNSVLRSLNDFDSRLLAHFIG